MHPDLTSTYRDVMPGVRSRLDAAELRRRLAAADVAVLDVDECMMPGYAQIALGHRLLRDAPGAGGPAGPRVIRAGRLIALGACLYGLKLLPGDPVRKNLRLHTLYGLALRGIERAAFRRVMPDVWRTVYPEVRPCLRRLAGRRPVGVISLGLDCLLDGLSAALAEGGEPIPFRFLEGNRIVWLNDRFAGLAAPICHGPLDKAAVYETEAARHGWRTPLVIGHNADETELCAIAGSAGGLSVGIGARPAHRDRFHVLLPRGAWGLLEEFLRAYDVE
ncbi:MAG TPA: hypothetical protein PK176_09850 [Acidobacteriota bacterium]|nr:hypothetical protein [Acidobacteriota bacterium]HQM63603.1 hypothetical protein [Acidobacteriota bacterium]